MIKTKTICLSFPVRRGRKLEKVIKARLLLFTNLWLKQKKYVYKFSNLFISFPEENLESHKGKVAPLQLSFLAPPAHLYFHQKMLLQWNVFIPFLPSPLLTPKKYFTNAISFISIKKWCSGVLNKRHLFYSHQKMVHLISFYQNLTTTSFT